jgi:hypothetical protein
MNYQYEAGIDAITYSKLAIIFLLFPKTSIIHAIWKQKGISPIWSSEISSSPSAASQSIR